MSGHEQPQLDERVWQAWLDKGRLAEKASAKKYRLVGVVVAILAVALYFFKAAN